MERAGNSVSSTLEDYLEAILDLEGEKKGARSGDIARALSVHKSTVTAALKQLAQKGLIAYSPYEAAILTKKGRAIAEEVTQSHRIIRRFLREVLLLDEKTAEENACRIEHDMDEEVIQRLVLFAQFVKACPRAGKDWLEQFSRYAREGGAVRRDNRRAKKFVDEFRRRLKQGPSVRAAQEKSRT